MSNSDLAVSVRGLSKSYTIAHNDKRHVTLAEQVLSRIRNPFKGATTEAFAVAAHLSPDILIVDEVLAVGDAEFQQKCLGKMKDVATSGRTVLFVSHSMQAVTALCNCGILLRNGSVEYQGNVSEATGRYLGLVETNLAEGHQPGERRAGPEAIPVP